MKIIRSFKITPNLISRYKSGYLLKISESKEITNGSWFIYVYNKYYDTHTFEPLGLVKTTDNEIHFDNGQKLVKQTTTKSDIYYYGSIDLLFNIKIMIPIEEKEPSQLSINEIIKQYNAIKNLPYFQAVYN